ncbi:MAG: hypothetical protein M1818_001764 [Claussenomyces sp. TS43310]|nr:MAG: hypothetical protein M1818_001764 [Claussenomyces sp. TS43310]
MPRLLRQFCNTSHVSAGTIAAQFLSKPQSLHPQIRTQLLDKNQLQQFATTLNRPMKVSTNTILPPCYHLAFFTPLQVEAELGADGSDTPYNPDAPFTRRMWAGGELTWSGQNTLKAEQNVSETTKVLSAEAKRTKAGEDMIVVGVEKTFENDNGVALVDRRSWIFRPAITNPMPVAPRPTEVALSDGPHTRDFTQTAVTLFRFSALTFNGHKIHYNREWCREMEGHRDLVVHGPLNLTLIVDMWRDVVAAGKLVMPKSVVYRATHPVYAGDTYRVILEDEREKISDARVVDSFGNVCMKANITRF